MIKISNIKIRGRVLDLPIQSQQASVLAGKIAQYINDNNGKADFKVEGRSITISNIKTLNKGRSTRIGSDRETILVRQISSLLQSNNPPVSASVRVE